MSLFNKNYSRCVMDQPLKGPIVLQHKSKLGKSEPRKVSDLQDHVSDPRQKDPRPRLEFGTYRIETLGFDTYKFEALISKSLEFRD
jgi:hypothetical protein